jgi:hypothetical protein
VLLLLALSFLPSCSDPDNRAPRSASTTSRCAAEPYIRSTVTDSGKSLEYTYHFDRNALLDSRLTKGALYAVTQSGDLLAFHPKTLAHQTEQVAPEAAVCLGDGPDQEVLVGFESGRCARISGPDLDLEDLGDLPGEPLWIARRQGPEGSGLLAVYRRAGEAEMAEAADLSSGRSVALPLSEKTSYVYCLDRAGRLFIGEDRGEWGGSIRVVEAGFSETREVTRTDLPVLGFLNCPDGRLLAYGGSNHRGMSWSFVAAVERSGLKYLSIAARDREERPAGLSPEGAFGGPHAPFACVLAEENGFLVVSDDHLYRANETFSEWTELVEFDTRIYWGHRYALGYHLPVRRAHRAPDGTILISTVRDGVLNVDPAARTVRRSIVADQLEIREVRHIRSSGGTVVVTDGHGENHPLVLKNGTWRRHPVYPPIEPEEGRCWDKYSVWPAPDGSTVSFATTNVLPGPVHATRWRDRGSEALEGHEIQDVWSAYVAPDGSLRDAGRFNWRFEVVTLDRSNWTLLHGEPARLSRGPGEMMLLPQAPDGRVPDILDAVGVSPREMLIASTTGIFRFTPGTNELRSVPVSIPDTADIAHICVDGLGRLWLGGHGLYLREDDAAEPERIDVVPPLVRGRVTALVADPDRPDAVLVAVRRRGLLLIRLSR